MPQSTPERRRRWGISPLRAIAHLERQGYTLDDKWEWSAPPGQRPTERENDAMCFLIEEWDFGGLKGD